MQYLKQFKYLPIFFCLAIIACSPKAGESVTKAEDPPPVPDKTEFTDHPCMTLNKLPYSIKDETETAYVLYKDQIKMGNFKAAYPLWKKAYHNAPAANGSIKYQFEDGIAIYKHFYAEATDSILKRNYVDTIMQIYDKRIECFGEPAYIAGRKAFDYYYVFQDESDPEEIYALFKQVLDAKGAKTDYFVVNPFAKILTDKVLDEEISIEEGSKYANILLETIEQGTQSGENAEAWEIINSYAPARLEILEGVEGFYDCDYYLKKYVPLYIDSDNDCEIINKAYSRLLYGQCDKNLAIVKELAAAKEKKCYTPPPQEGPLKLAYNAYTEGRYKEAVRLFDDFVALTEDPAKKAKYNLLIAKIFYGDLRNFPESRRYALESAKWDPKSGAPYLLIGKLYASSGPLCGPGRGWDSQIVTWPAIDMFVQAKSDPAVADEANKLIRTYSQYMPTREDIFSRSIEKGSTYKIGCWINRTTTVRTSD
jgi:hypothetical protein